MDRVKALLFCRFLRDVCADELLDVALLIGDAGEHIQNIGIGAVVELDRNPRRVRSIIARLRRFLSRFDDGHLLASRWGGFPPHVVDYF